MIFFHRTLKIGFWGIFMSYCWHSMVYNKDSYLTAVEIFICIVHPEIPFFFFESPFESGLSIDPVLFQQKLFSSPCKWKLPNTRKMSSELFRIHFYCPRQQFLVAIISQLFQVKSQQFTQDSIGDTLGISLNGTGM